MEMAGMIHKRRWPGCVLRVQIVSVLPATTRMKKRGFGNYDLAANSNLLKMRVVSMGRRNTQLRATFLENKS
jgi:hypothetical protein